MSRGKKSKRKKHQKQATLENAEAEKHLNKRPPHVDIAGRVETNFPPDLIKKYDDASEKEDGWNRKIFAAEIIAAFLLALSVGAVAWQGFLIRDSNRINREALESVQRAFVSFQQIEDERVQVPNQPGVHNWSMSAKFDNNGATSATNVAGMALLASLPGEPTEEQFIGGYQELPTISIPPKSTRNIRVSPEVIPERLIFGIDLGEPITADKTTKSHIDRNLYIWAWVYYRDIFPETKPHVTEFCTRISNINFIPDKPARIVFDYSGCRTHNCDDQQCKDYDEIVRTAERISAPN